MLTNCSGVRANFIKLTSNQVKTQGVNYDYGSIMHYSAYAFSRNGRPTIESKNPRISSEVMGQRVRLSSKDIEHVSALYCSGLCMRENVLSVKMLILSLSLYQLSQPAGVAGVPGAPAVDPAMEVLATAHDRVREAARAVVVAHSSRLATASLVPSRWQSGQPGAAGVGVLSAVGWADSREADSVYTETLALGPLSSTETATESPALWPKGCGLTGHHGLLALPHVAVVSRVAAGTASVSLARAPALSRGAATQSNVRHQIPLSLSPSLSFSLYQAPVLQVLAMRAVIKC